MFKEKLFIFQILLGMKYDNSKINNEISKNILNELYKNNEIKLKEVIDLDNFLKEIYDLSNFNFFKKGVYLNYSTFIEVVELSNFENDYYSNFDDFFDLFQFFKNPNIWFGLKNKILSNYFLKRNNIEIKEDNLFE
jgi:hypothetical protein